MINIETLCAQTTPQYYAAIMRDNAAMHLITGAFIGKPPLITPTGELINYNIYLRENYRRMEEDSGLPKCIKAEIRRHVHSGEHRLTSPALEGWHVLRTPTPLAGQQLREVLTEIQARLEMSFYSTSLGLVPLRRCIVMEEVYASGPSA